MTSVGVWKRVRANIRRQYERSKIRLVLLYPSTDGEVRAGASFIVTEAMLSEHLSTSSGLPDPDLLLRTSGEMRVSNFLLWQLAYTEMFFVSKFWPEISRDDFRGILRQFSMRKRRFGA